MSRGCADAGRVRKWRDGPAERPAGVGEQGLRAFLFIAAALALALTTGGCDRCGDPVKFNLPGLSACSDSK